jgi:hypothetical protein
MDGAANQKARTAKALQVAGSVLLVLAFAHLLGASFWHTTTGHPLPPSLLDLLTLLAPESAAELSMWIGSLGSRDFESAAWFLIGEAPLFGVLVVPGVLLTGIGRLVALRSSPLPRW